MLLIPKEESTSDSRNNYQESRGIQEGKLEGLTELVVLVGPNSSGKSTILDALMLGASPNVADGLNAIIGRRQAAGEAIPWIIFRAKGRQVAPAEVLIESDSPQARVVTVSQPGNVPTAGLSFVSNPVSLIAEGEGKQSRL